MGREILSSVNVTSLDTDRLWQLRGDGRPFILTLNRKPVAIVFRYPPDESDIATMKLHIRKEEVKNELGESIQ